MITIEPVKDKQWMFDEAEKQILILLKEHIYFPLLECLDDKLKLNSSSPLIEALRSGRVQFYNGLFTGKFNASISKFLYSIGAIRDLRAAGFRILLKNLPSEVKAAISVSEASFLRILDRVQKKLDKIDTSKIEDYAKFEDLFDTSLWEVNKSLNSSLKGLVVAPELRPEERKEFAREYSKNMDLWIKDWSAKEIKSLRETVELMVTTGGRRDHLASVIAKSYGVSKSKAKFLAKQETSLMLSKFKEVRYKSAGIEEYIWKCVNGSKDHQVRPTHKVLDGKRFSFQNPPVTDTKGNRNNPGQDYGCRCYAKPIVRF